MAASETAARRWSLQVATVLGIPIRVHFTFVFLLIWYGFVSSSQGDNVPIALLFLLLVFACVVLHELGHAAMARRFGVRTREIVLYPIGGVARLENIPGGKAELLIAIAGPLVNLGLALLLFSVGLALGMRFQSQLLNLADLVGRLVGVNLVLFAFNLLPAFPMDGGRILRAALSLRMPPERATDIAAAVGQAFAILFAAAGILSPGGNIPLMLIALFVYIGATQEAFFHRQLAAVRGRTAREAMITRFETLAPQDSLSRAAEHLLATHQQDFPVVDAWKRAVGVLPRARLLHGLAQQGSSAAVLEVMDRDVVTVSPDDDLDDVLERLRTRPDVPVIVLSDGAILGMITLENLTEFIEIARRTAPESKRT